MNFSLFFPQQATQTSALQQRDAYSPYSTNNAPKDLGWGAVPWKHLDLMGLPHPSAYLWFCTLLLLLNRKTNNMREAEITVFSLLGLLMPSARARQAILSNCNCYAN